MTDKKKCVHILAIKETSSNACYIVDSETCEEYIEGLKRTAPSSMVHKLEWLKFCPRCGIALPCPKCGAIDSGQYGEYPCSACGVPALYE
jgi:hypothetical protein